MAEAVDSGASHSEVPVRAETKETREEVIEALDKGVSILQEDVSNNPENKQNEWTLKTVTDAKAKSLDRGTNTFKNEFQDLENSTTLSLREGVPVDDLIQFLFVKASNYPEGSEEYHRVREIAITLDQNSRPFFEGAHRLEPTILLGRNRQEAKLISLDHRATGSMDGDWFKAQEALLRRRELMIPHREKARPVEEADSTAQEEAFRQAAEREAILEGELEESEKPLHSEEELEERVEEVREARAESDRLNAELTGSRNLEDRENQEPEIEVNNEDGLKTGEGDEQTRSRTLEERENEDPEVDVNIDESSRTNEEREATDTTRSRTLEDRENQEPEIEVDIDRIPPEEEPTTQPSTPEQIIREATILNRQPDYEKRARELAIDQYRQEYKGEPIEGNKWSPATWLKHARRLPTRIRMRLLEQYYIQTYTERALKAKLDADNPYMFMNIAANSIPDQNALRGQAEEAGIAKIEQLKTGEHISGERIAEATGQIKTALTEEILKPIVNGDLTTSEQVHQRLREFIQANQGNQQIEEFFGSTTTLTGRMAEGFATDLLGLGEQIKTDLAAHKYGLEQLDSIVKINLGRAEWAAETEGQYNRHTDRAIRWVESHQMRGRIINPATISAASSIATYAILRGAGVGGRALQISTPVVGAMTGALFCGARRNFELKTDIAAHRVERAYGRQIPADAERRQSLERFSYQSASVNELLNGGGEEALSGADRDDLQELLSRDLSEANPQNRESVIRRVAEIKSRLDFSAEQKVDLLTFEGETQVEQGRLQLIKAVVEARAALRSAGMDPAEIETLETRMSGEWKERFTDNREQQDRAFARHRLAKSIEAGAFGAAVGGLAGLGTQQALAWGARHTPLGEVGYFSKMKGQTFAEKGVNGIGRLLGHPDIAKGPSNLETFQAFYEQGGSTKVGDYKLGVSSVDHSITVMDSKGNAVKNLDLSMSEEGHIKAVGHIPEHLRDELQHDGFKINQGENIVAIKQKELLKPSGTHPDTTIGRQTTIPNGTEWVRSDSNPDKWNLVIATRHDEVLLGNASFDPKGHLIYEYQNPNLDLSETVTGTEAKPILGPEGEWAKHSTPIEHRHWGDYFTEQHERDELRLYVQKHGDALTLDMSKMGISYGHGVPPVDVQDVIRNHEAGFYVSFKGEAKHGIWISDGVDGKWDGTVTLDPSDTDPSHVVTGTNGEKWQLGELSKVILNQDAISGLPDGNLVTEIGHQDVFRIGNPNGGRGFIEAGRILTDENGKTLQAFATIQGTTSLPQEASVSTFASEINLKEPIIGSVPENLPTFDIVPPEFEPPPMIPLDWAPRYPLEKLEEGGPWPEAIPFVAYTYLGQPSPEAAASYEAKRSPRLKEKPDSILDPKEEIEWYFQQQNPEYLHELNALNEQIGIPMGDKCRVSIVMPVASHQEEDNIYKTLLNYSKQKNRDGTSYDMDKFEVLILLNRPSDKAPDGTASEVQRFINAHPEVNVRVAEKIFNPEDVTFGRIIKNLYDLALLRSNSRMTPDNKEMILLTNDADSTTLSEHYVSEILSTFDKPENTHVDGVLGKLEWSQEAYDSYPVFHAANRYMQFVEAQLRRGHAPEMGSWGANFALKSSIYAAIGGVDPETGAGADKDLSRMIKHARFGRLKEIPADRYPIRFSNTAWLESNPRRGLDYYMKGIPIVYQWNDFDKRMLETDEARTIKWAEASAEADLENLDIERLEGEINEVLGAYGIPANSEMNRRALEWLGVEAEVINNRIKITNVDKLIEGLKEYRDKQKSQMKKTAKQSEETIEEESPEVLEEEIPTARISHEEATGPSPEPAEIIRGTLPSAPSTPLEATAEQEPEITLEAEAPVEEETKDLVEKINKTLESTPGSSAHVETPAPEILDYLRTIKLPAGAKIGSASYTPLSGNQMQITSSINVPLGKVDFNLTLANSTSGLIVVSRQVNPSFLLRGKKGEMEQELEQLNTRLVESINQRINSQWLTSKVSIDGDKFAIDFQKR